MKLKTIYFFSEFTILDLSKVHFEENYKNRIVFLYSVFLQNSELNLAHENFNCRR